MSLRRQSRCFGFRTTSRSVFIITHAGTRWFCRSSFASRFFLAFDFLLILFKFTLPVLKFLFLSVDSPRVDTDPTEDTCAVAVVGIESDGPVVDAGKRHDVRELRVALGPGNRLGRGGSPP